jgi:hypothetical protein
MFKIRLNGKKPTAGELKLVCWAIMVPDIFEIFSFGVSLSPLIAARLERAQRMCGMHGGRRVGTAVEE